MNGLCDEGRQKKTRHDGRGNHFASTINNLFIWPFLTVAFAVIVNTADGSPLVDIYALRALIYGLFFFPAAGSIISAVILFF